MLIRRDSPPHVAQRRAAAQPDGAARRAAPARGESHLSAMQRAVDGSPRVLAQRQQMDALLSATTQHETATGFGSHALDSKAPVQRVVTERPDGTFYSDVTGRTYTTRDEAQQAELTFQGNPQPLPNTLNALHQQQIGALGRGQQIGLQQYHNPVGALSLAPVEDGFLRSQATNRKAAELEEYWHYAYEYGGIDRDGDSSDSDQEDIL